MRPRTTVPVLLACLSIALTAGCTDDAVPSVADLGSVVPAADDAPDGLRYAERLSGPADLEAFRGDPEERAAMRSAGFRSAWTSLYASPDLLRFFTLSDPNASPPSDTRLLTASAVLFADPSGAARGLEAFRQEAERTHGGQDVAPPPGGFAISGTRNGRRTATFGVQEGPVVVLVGTQGAVPGGDALRILAQMRTAARAEIA
jgi:hypothetical protein